MNYTHGGNVYKHIRESGGSLEELLDFSANINPLGLSPMGLEAMSRAYEQLSHYPDPDYVALKTVLSNFYSVPMDWLATYNGAAEAMHAFFDYLKPKRALLHGPGFVEYEKILRKLGTVIDWYSLSETADFKLDVDAYTAALNQCQPDLAIICSPNNPTGKLVSLTDLQQIEKTLSQWGGTLAIDEAFIEFSKAPQSYSSALTPDSQVVVFKSLTKFFGVPGLRLGALITADSAFHRWDKAFGVPWRINSFAECYGIEAVKDQAYMAATRDYISEAKAELLKGLRTIPGIKAYESDADYLMMYIDERTHQDLADKLAMKHILIRDCSNYKGLGKGYYRVAVKAKEANHRLIEVLKEVMA